MSDSLTVIVLSASISMIGLASIIDAIGTMTAIRGLRKRIEELEERKP